MWSQFPPNLSCLQNNPPENIVVSVPAKWTAGYLRFGGNWHYIIFRRIVLGLIFFRLKNFFGARFRYKLMYYNLYHMSDLRKIVRFLCKIECIEFECNKFVLVLVQIDLIILNIQIVLVQLELKLIHICYIQGQYIQFCIKSDT